MPPCIFYGRVSVHIGEEPKTESIVVVVGWVGKAVHNDAVVLGVVDLAHPAVQLVVGDGGPVDWLLVGQVQAQVQVYVPV